MGSETPGAWAWSALAQALVCLTAPHLKPLPHHTVSWPLSEELAPSLAPSIILPYGHLFCVDSFVFMFVSVSGWEGILIHSGYHDKMPQTGGVQL